MHARYPIKGRGPVNASELDTSLNALKARGHRLTPTRVAILQTLEHHSSAISAEDLLAALRARHLSPNKTTIYRELAFLLAQGLIVEVDLGERKKRYESTLAGHHHHLICVNCHSVSHVELGEHLARHEARIGREKNFLVLRHSLEFFGLCERCRS